MPTLQAAAGESGNNQPMVMTFEPGAASRVGGHIYENDKSGTIRANAGDNAMAVAYGISSYDSNAMKSSNPHSGIYEANTSRTLDLNGGNPGCNQGGIAVVQGADLYNGKLSGDVAVTLNTNTNSTGAGPTLCIDQGAGKSQCGITENVSPTLATTHGGEPVVYDASRRHDYEPFGDVCETVQAHYGTGGGNTPIVMESINGEIAGTLDASYYKGCGERQGIEREVVCVGNGQIHQDMSDKVGALNCMHDQQALLVTTVDCRNGTENADINGTLQSKEQGYVESYQNSVGSLCARDYKGVGSVVRRLTPLECERLQGYPDGWTDIGDWVDSKGKKHKGDSDSPRYKALGNSIALPFWQWMAERMVNMLHADGVEHPTMASLFDGIGGFPLVYSRFGCEPIWASEIEEFPIAVTKIRFPSN